MLVLFFVIDKISTILYFYSTYLLYSKLY